MPAKPLVMSPIAPPMPPIGGADEKPAPAPALAPVSNRPIMSAMPPDAPPATVGLATLSGVAVALCCSWDAGAAPSKSMSSRFSRLLCGGGPWPLAAADAAATDAAMGFSAASWRCSWIAARWISSAPKRPLPTNDSGGLW